MPPQPHVQVIYAHALTKKGDIVSYIAIKRDVTARRAAKDAQRFLAAIVENSEDAIIGATPAGVILTWNRGAGTLLGSSAEEAIGKQVSSFIAPERMSRLATCIYQVSQGHVVSNYEGMCLRKDGSSVAVAATGFPIRASNGGVEAIIAMLRDITQRRQLEAVLHESEGRLRVMAEDRVQFLAYHDALTELPNRALLQDRLENSGWRSPERSEGCAAVSQPRTVQDHQ